MLRGYFVVWLLALGVLVACDGELRPLTIPSAPLATEAVPATITATPLPVATETAVPTARFTYQGITFRYANGLMRRLTTDQTAARQGLTDPSPTTPPMYYFGVPDALLFNFEDMGSSPAPSRLVVQRLHDEDGLFYAAYPEGEIGRFTQLASQLEAQTSHDPLTSYLEFENGSGVRAVGYLPVYSETVPFSDAQLFYLFEGLTADGRYHVWLQFNLQTPILPDEPGQFTQAEREAVAGETAAYQTYLDQQLALVHTLPPSAFTPDLALLDGLLQTLFIPDDASSVSSLPVNEAGCTNTAVYINAITIANGTRIKAGDSFLKTWRVQNTGSCLWSAAYQLVSDDGQLLHDNNELPVVLPGATVDISLLFHAPVEPGIYQETWQLQSPRTPQQEPTPFGPTLTLLIEVIP